MSTGNARDLPGWAAWVTSAHEAPYTVGIEEELMLLDAETYDLAFRSEEVMDRLPEVIRERASLETHASVLEVDTSPHRTAAEAVAELGIRRLAVCEAIADLGLTAAAAGTHPTATWEDTKIPDVDRYRRVLRSMRVLARREPTMAMHVHVAVPSSEEAIRALNGLRHRLPVLLALSANSPFWQGRDTGLASTRTPLFHAFPRTGIAAPFEGYADWVERVGILIESGAIPDPTFLWWDARLQPGIGTVEVRIMDAQVRLADAAAVAAFVQALVLVAINDDRGPNASHPEVLLENRFRAARDGIDATFIDVDGRSIIPFTERLNELLEHCGPHAKRLGCADDLARVQDLARVNGAVRQRKVANARGIAAVAPWLAAQLLDPAEVRAAAPLTP